MTIFSQLVKMAEHNCYMCNCLVQRIDKMKTHHKDDIDYFEERIKNLHTQYGNMIDNIEKHCKDIFAIKELRIQNLKDELEELYAKKDKSSFERFMADCTTNEIDSEITFTKLYKYYSAWFQSVANPMADKLKVDAFKSLLEKKLNCTITKTVKGIDFKEESETLS